ncbi:ABC transporter [Microthyrium microscopicum]|uniref:ABC transporter n=1 Tax=Microthyrium microscopicum TaxID=703497 RepID=A0A6A6UKY4_9PEZI|nr:ABC transporter [Microthyrium microscopicum]
MEDRELSSVLSHQGNEKPGNPSHDIERGILGELVNDSVDVYRWSHCSVEVKDRATGNQKLILDDISGEARAGEVIALMGPSGSGKTTLLNVLARRAAAAKAKVTGELLVDDQTVSLSTFCTLVSFVEQEDALIGSLSTRETIEIAAHLSRPRQSTRAGRKAITEQLLSAFGLNLAVDTFIGTPIRKGISGGQKRRILFLDEPTLGLDSTASREVMSYICKVARELKLVIFALFDRLALLSQGKLCYFGLVSEVNPYFENIGSPVPLHTNTAEYLLDLVNADFEGATNIAESQVVHCEFKKASAIDAVVVMIPLLKRTIMKSYRDLLAYGVRYAMYLGLAIMMGTSFINAIFFGLAFMSFMAVAYVPAYLEDRAVYVKDRVNGLYGLTAFMLINTLVGLPYLFGISLLFSIIAYWLLNFDLSATAFFNFVMWLFLDLLAAEALVVFVSSLIPSFVIALALVAFANGLWMSVGGFLHPVPLLNPFWKYGMMVNEFARRTYSCIADCKCNFPTEDLTCRIPGTSDKWVGIMIAIIVVYRFLGWIALYVRKC